MSASTKKRRPTERARGTQHASGSYSVMKPLLVSLSLFAGVGTVWGLQSAQSAAVQPSGDRPIVVLSDLHMGVGRDAAGAWHPYEDLSLIHI